MLKYEVVYVPSRARLVTQKERLRYCLARRQELEVVLKDWELIGGLMKGYKERAALIVEDMRMVQNAEVFLEFEQVET